MLVCPSFFFIFVRRPSSVSLIVGSPSFGRSVASPSFGHSVVCPKTL
jgi:hypothetical protein